MTQDLYFINDTHQINKCSRVSGVKNKFWQSPGSISLNSLVCLFQTYKPLLPRLNLFLPLYILRCIALESIFNGPYYQTN